MNILPTLTEIRKIASDGKYRIVPVSCELLSDFTTPIEVMKILKNGPPTAICWNQHRQTRNGDGIHFLVLIQSWKSPVHKEK